MDTTLTLPPTTTPFRPPPGLTTATMPTASTDKTGPLRKIAEEFEGMVLKELLAPMFEALDTDGLGGGGAGEAMFRPMLVDNYAKGLAAKGGVGLADSVFKELVRMQGGAS